MAGPGFQQQASQSQSLSQQQKLSPQMQQSLAVLQAPTLELRKLVQQELEENPVLEDLTEDISLDEKQAEEEGLDKIFTAAGMEWREPGCSMCLAMNSDKLGAGEHCASTSNRNFEGRQGFGGRTHLVSPAMAAAAAVAGHFVDVRNW